MPLYEYECLECGALVEKIQKFSDPPLTTCEKCGGALQRLLSPPAIHFKGSGWYVTDYARKPAPAKSEKSAPTESAKKTETSTASSPSKSPTSPTGD